MKRIGKALSRIWNSFLRGQLIVMFVSAIVYAIILNLLGVSYAIGIAIFAGLARFVPPCSIHGERNPPLRPIRVRRTLSLCAG